MSIRASTRFHTAIVTFDLQRDGSVRNVRIAQSSGNKALDYSAQRAIYDASPFPAAASRI